MKKPLQGIRVLDLSRLLPGPYATMLLAEMGAEVIKIETPRVGDYARSMPEEFGGAGMFHLLNRGKKSVGLNYRNKKGRVIFHQLAQTADVIIEQFKPGSMAKWGFDYDSIKAYNPGVVYCSLSGYGQNGPYRNRAGHDINYTAIGGMLGLNATPDTPPVLPGTQIADLSGAMLAATAILGALVGRAGTGEGTYLDVAMLDSVVSWMLPVAGAWLFDTQAPPQPNQLPLAGGFPSFNVYETADGRYLSVGALEPPFWSAFCQTIERPDLLSRTFDPTARAEVAATIRTRTQANWLAAFDGVEACVEPVLNIQDALTHPQVTARKLVDTENPDANGYPTTRVLPAFGSSETSPAPELGQHSREILTDVGVADSEIDALIARKVVAQA